MDCIETQDECGRTAASPVSFLWAGAARACTFEETSELDVRFCAGEGGAFWTAAHGAEACLI